MESPKSEESRELAHVRSYWANMLPNSPIYSYLFSDVVLVSASWGTILATLRTQPVHMNSKGTVHGSVLATIVDGFGGLAIASTGNSHTGLSTDIHITYVSAARLGDTMEIEAKASGIGRCMAFTNVEIRSQGRVVATGTHSKYIKV